MRWLLILFFWMLPVGAQVIRIDGGAAPMENIFKRIQPAFEAKSGLRLDLRENGPELALLALQKGEVDAASAGLSPESWFELMASKGHVGITAAAFQARRIGFDKINVFLHSDIVFVELDKAQLKGLFTGKTTNWKELGGPDLPVLVVLGEKVPGTNKVFQEQMMDRAPYSPNARWVGATPEVIRTLVNTPGAIGIGPLSALMAQKLNSPVTPEVGRPITLLTKGEPSTDVKKMLEFAGGEGKSLIAK
jgi:phosphate transport system substrate-binding protein